MTIRRVQKNAKQTCTNSLYTFPRDILIHQLGCSNFGGPTDRRYYVVKTLQALLALLSCNFNAQLGHPSAQASGWTFVPRGTPFASTIDLITRGDPCQEREKPLPLSEVLAPLQRSHRQG